MSAFAPLTVAGLEVFSCRNVPTPEVLTLFRESDRLVTTRESAARMGLTDWPVHGEERDGSFYCYRNTAHNVAMRLEVMDFHLRDVEAAFNASLEALLDRYSDTSCFGSDENMQKVYSDVVRRLRGLSYAEWRRDIAAGLDACRPNAAEQSPSDKDAGPEKEELVDRLLEDDLYLGFPQSEDAGVDIRLVLRAVLDIAAQQDLVVYNFTPIIDYDWVTEESRLCEETTKTLLGQYPTHERIVVLTEGATDGALMSRSLRVLYPHLFEYFSFMDFGLADAPGGAGQLVNIVRAFAGAGIRARIVAVFDNDTAAAEALSVLANVPMPDNMRIVRLPDIAQADHYPTIGPQGPTLLNVNGLAGSIEMYFCQDTLTDDGELTPVQWRGYSEKVGRYQGEILNKRVLQRRYAALLDAVERSPDEAQNHDWTAMRALLCTVITAFGADVSEQ